MTRSAYLRRAAFTLAAAVSGPLPAFAQTEIVATANPDADALAGEMRVLAADPQNLRALLAAGELSGRLGDGSAALAFFARAEKIDPANPRIPAGRAAILVMLQRPGEALLLFGEAEARGLPARDYAADRALAYDLLGAPQLAQKDYKVAIAARPQDETVRRYALSLGITGKLDEAMAVLDPLLRKSDRAAWRARAFILAMNGDVPGAERIAASMMPGSMGAGLTPFFRRLGTLSPADRAFAVHFGELRSTQARRADAALVPDLPAYVPEPRPQPVAVAAPPPPAPVAAKGRDRRARRDREQVAALTRVTVATDPAPAPPAGGETLPPPPSYRPVPEPMLDPIPRTVPVRIDAGAMQAGAPPARAAPARAAPPPGPARDSFLAALIAGIRIPEEERKAMEAAAAQPAPAPVRVAAAAKPRPEPRPDATAKKPPPKPDPAKAEPSRVWVQIAGGAEEKALSLTWNALAKKSPAAFKGRSGWWAPFKATNRLLAGPFKTAKDAQAFVNLVKKDGVNGFVFTSDPGQKITKLAGK